MDQTGFAEVLIIGGGPAGLTLAQILLANNVSCRIFERDPAIDARAQGWAVALIEALEPLQRLLPKNLGDLYSTSVNAATGTIDTGVVINGRNGKISGQVGGAPKWHSGSMLRVRRERLRQFLQRGLPIEFGKEYESYQEDQDGVTILFRDGSRARGSILIGSDGASSRVRSQLLDKDAELADLIPIVGTCRLSQEELRNFRTIANALFIVCTDKLRFLVGLLDTEPDESGADAYWAVCYRSPNPEKESEWTQAASKEELFRLAVDLTSGLDPAHTNVIQKSGAEGVKTPPLKFREFSTSRLLPPGRVTLMGDAAHTMMPLRGAGANTALEDACDLATLLLSTEKRTRREDVISILQQYSQIMIPRGCTEVAATSAAGYDDSKVLSIDTRSFPSFKAEARL